MFVWAAEESSFFADTSTSVEMQYNLQVQVIQGTEQDFVLGRNHHDGWGTICHNSDPAIMI